MPRDRDLEKRGLTLALFSVGALIVALIGFSLFAVRGFTEATRWVLHTVEVRLTLAHAYTALIAAESAQRSYLVAHDPTFFAHLDELEARAPREIRRLHELTSDNPRQIENLARLDLLVDERIKLIDDVLRIDREQGAAAAAASVRAGKGNNVMARIDALIGDIDGEEIRLQAERTARARRNQVYLTIALITMLAFGTAGVVIALSSSRRELRARRRHQEEQSKLIEELEDTNTALQRSNRDLDQFAYVASHDLKAPLRGIANLAAWIEEDLGVGAGDEVRKQLELMRGRVHRMDALIEGILSYSRAGRVDGKPERVDTRELVADVTALVSPPAGAIVEVTGTMPVLQTERTPLQQVFLNLTANAIRHANRPDPHVTISSKRLGGFVEFAVADNGPGIAPEYHDRIWGIFQTLQARDRVEGAGIGLSIVKKIVEQRGGNVRVESSEGKGSTFFFSWPQSHAS